jgi:glycosyltransferase involved in cell wall biosynthesis
MTALSVKQFISQISIIVPCLNEAGNVTVLYEEICRHCSTLSIELVFVDDGSDDATKQALDQLRKKDGRVSVV